MPKMTEADLLPIWVENPVAFEAEPQHIQDKYREEVEMLREGAKLDISTGKIKRPRGDRETMPPGYGRESMGRGYYRVYDPNGVEIEGPDNGKHHGKDGAADAAWGHYRNN